MKIPFLLMTEDQRQALLTSGQLKFLNTQTQNFDICPEAKALFHSLIETEDIAHQDEMKDTAELHAAVHLGIAAKPDVYKRMQFRHYLGF